MKEKKIIIKAIFFDFDGTLFGSKGLGKKVLLEIISEKKISLDVKGLLKLPYYNMQDKLKIFYPQYYDWLWPEWNKRFTKRILKECKPFIETKKTIIGLNKKGIILFISSTKFSYHIKNILTKHKLIDYFSEIIGRETVQPPKPDPKAIFDLIKKYSLKKEECIYVGDSLLDEEAAKNSGLRFVFVNRKSAKETSVKNYWKKVKKLDELLKIVE